MYGFGNDDLVKLGGTKEWRAPEWHHRRFRIQDARKTDVYSFTKVCEWLLNFDLGHDNVGVWPKRHVQPHMEQFYRLGLCDDPHERTDSMPLLLLVLSNAMRAQSESLFEDLYRINPIGFTKLLRDKHGSDQATTIVESIDSNRQERFSGAR